MSTTARSTTQVLVRPMREVDIPQVLALEREAFPTQSPNTSFHRELASSLASYLVACRARSAHKDGETQSLGEEILGYTGLWFIIDEAHLITLAVRETERRRGIGQLLLASALELARERAATMMTLEVRASNTAAQVLYEKFDFRRVGVRRGYYTDNHEDAYLMTVENISSDHYQNKLAALKDSCLTRLSA